MILGPIPWFSKTGTQHRAFVVPISYLIELEILQFFRLIRSLSHFLFFYFVLTLFVFKTPNYMLARTLTDRVV